MPPVTFPYFLIVHNARSDLRSLVARCALNSQCPLMKGLSRYAIVRQFNVDWILNLEQDTSITKQAELGDEKNEHRIVPM